jgi:hypothetical protein
VNVLNRVLRYLSIWLRPPKITTLEFDEVDQPALSFVSPVFVLSTGRCGTKWLTGLLRRDPRMRVNHSDYPELIRHSRLAYEQYAEMPRVFQEIIRAARDGYILDAYRRGQVYVETNNRITFFAYAVQAVYPQARFIHLMRHPGDFVRSGLRRGWYHGGRHDVGRIRDIVDPAGWEEMTDTAKIAYLWNETNQYIETFAKTLDMGAFMQVRAEDMFSGVQATKAIADFVGAKIQDRIIRSMLKKKINRQMTGNILPYREWSRESKMQLQKYASLAERYGYEI